MNQLILLIFQIIFYHQIKIFLISKQNLALNYIIKQELLKQQRKLPCSQPYQSVFVVFMNQNNYTKAEVTLDEDDLFVLNSLVPYENMQTILVILKMILMMNLLTHIQDILILLLCLLETNLITLNFYLICLKNVRKLHKKWKITSQKGFINIICINIILVYNQQTLFACIALQIMCFNYQNNNNNNNCNLLFKAKKSNFQIQKQKKKYFLFFKNQSIFQKQG
ncbi:transmembrane protein, putative (macronuclear) [Tetrahymena thermophila SB210]|uniref:Transmembrane protein, putative n=1 Tax=Tetrahymena thermophila (strain SB210) TaxID=312017 RepID=W7XK67_TETTS|nr:transmembrane protein, putative [Tetrahymena thermophila SB210]EWS76266.1 transmembrane protein, putative [Tetrahymena thermophila SB210]|eukprot:XP_012651195.1 transmembrane protein, putative [Tetrahymena thermophila SB210]